MNIALQLYSIKEDAEVDFNNALALTAKAGYDSVEFAGYFGHNAGQMKAMLDAHNLKAVSTHIGLDRFKNAFDEEVAFAKTLGYKYLTCPAIYCDSIERITAAAEVFEDCAKKAKEHGMIVAYHNHAHEFEKLDGRYPLDILFELAPNLKFQADVFWLAYAGLDPIEFLKPYIESGRLCMIHAKEIAKSGKENVYIGQGRIDFRALSALCPPSQYPYIVEQEEYTGDRFEGICECFKGLKAALV